MWFKNGFYEAKIGADTKEKISFKNNRKQGYWVSSEPRAGGSNPPRHTITAFKHLLGSPRLRNLPN